MTSKRKVFPNQKFYDVMIAGPISQKRKLEKALHKQRMADPGLESSSSYFEFINLPTTSCNAAYGLF